MEERAFQAYKRQLENDLVGALEGHIRESMKTDSAYGELFGTTHVSDVVYNQEALHFTVRVFFVDSDYYSYHMEKSGIEALYLEPLSHRVNASVLQVHADRVRFEVISSSDQSDIRTRSGFGSRYERAPFEKLFPTDDNGAFFTLTDFQYKNFLSFRDLARGEPTPHLDEAFFERMLYFSTVTITTLGFGDIVPVEPVARLLVAVESILGIILMGLFLNALFNEKVERTKASG